MEIILLFCIVLLAIIQYLLENAIEQYERLLEEDSGQS